VVGADLGAICVAVHDVFPPFSVGKHKFGSSQIWDACRPKTDIHTIESPNNGATGYSSPKAVSFTTLANDKIA